MTFRLPNTSHKIAIFGRTGTGKTQFGAWGLSEAPYDNIPYIIVNYKGDELLNGIDRAREIGFNDKPKHPGIYMLRPEPDDIDEMEKFLRDTWHRENTGLFFDELYMVPQGRGLRSIITQGRSKHIPCFFLSQRPAWLSRFVISEADFLAAFHLHDPEDRKKIEKLMPSELVKTRVRLPPYHCWYYDVGEDELTPLAPVPSAEKILDRFDERLSPKRKFA